MAEIKKVVQVPGVTSTPLDHFPNVSKDKLGSGFGRFLVPLVAKTAVESVRSLASKATMPDIRREAARLGMSPAQYMLNLALLHEKMYGKNAKDPLLAITRLVHVLGKSGLDCGEMIHELNEAQKKLGTLDLHMAPMSSEALAFLR